MLVYCDLARGRSRLEADGAIHVATADHIAGINHGAVKATDFVAVVVLLEEETLAAGSRVALRLAVCHGSSKGHRRAVLRVGVTDAIAASIGEGYLRVGRSGDKVFRIITGVRRRVM